MTKTLEHHFALIFILTLNKHVVVTSNTTWRGNMHNWNFQGLIIREQKLEHLFCSSKIPISNDSFKIYICNSKLKIMRECILISLLYSIEYSILALSNDVTTHYTLKIVCKSVNVTLHANL